MGDDFHFSWTPPTQNENGDVNINAVFTYKKSESVEPYSGLALFCKKIRLCIIREFHSINNNGEDGGGGEDDDDGDG
jgi:hypothetical protein